MIRTGDAGGVMRGAAWVRLLVAVLLVAGGVAVGGESNSAEVRQITVADAIVLTLENNRGLVVERAGAQMTATRIGEERAAFDPTLRAGVERADSEGELNTVMGSIPTNGGYETVSATVGAGVRLPTGTRVDVEGRAVGLDADGAPSELDSVGAGISVTQSLLQGRRVAANLASLRQARLDAAGSAFELRGYAEALVARVEDAYWGYALALEDVQIHSNALAVAEQQFRDMQERVRVGTVAVLELAASQAEQAARAEALVRATNAARAAHLRLLSLVLAPGDDGWNRELVPAEALAMPAPTLEPVDAHVGVARAKRPDLNQARLARDRQELEVVRTRSGLLPRLDVFARLGRTGYAAAFDDAVRDLPDDAEETRVGIELEYPWGRRAEHAQARRAVLGVGQAEAALANLEQLAEVDVRTAYLDVVSAQQEVAASAETVRFREDAAKAEQEKLAVGSSTTLQLAQAQRDLLVAQLAYARGVTNSRRALVNLYRMDGTLLERRGVTVEVNVDE